MKLSPRQINDLLKVIETVRTMISWGEGGSFNEIDNPEKIDYKAIKSAERGINIIKTKIMQRN